MQTACHQRCRQHHTPPPGDARSQQDAAGPLHPEAPQQRSPAPEPSSGSIPFNAGPHANGGDAHSQEFDEILLDSPVRQPARPPAAEPLLRPQLPAAAQGVVFALFHWRMHQACQTSMQPVRSMSMPG
jgi:hypothetical protein